MRRGGLRSASVLSGGGTVLVGLIVWNAGNYLFFLVAGRALGPKDYGLLAALLAATVVVAVPAQGLQFTAARLVAAPPGGDAQLAEGIYRRFWRRCTGSTVGAATAASAGIIAAHLVWPTIPLAPFLVTVGLAMPLGFFFLALGRLQGEERFTAFSLCFILWGAPRPVILAPLAALGMGVGAGLGATGAATTAAVVTCIRLTRSREPARNPSAAEWREFTRPLLPVTVGLLGLGVLINLDVIVAKIALPSDSAGRFAAAAALAKAVFLAPQAASSVLLPRVAARAAIAQDTGLLIGLGVGITLAVGGLASLGMWAFSSPLLRITYGANFTGSAGLLGAYAGAATLLGALIVAINHHLGRGTERFLWGTAAIAGLQVLLFLALHDSQRAIVAVDGLAGAAGLILHECMFFRTGEAILPSVVRAARRSHELWNQET